MAEPYARPLAGVVLAALVVSAGIRIFLLRNDEARAVRKRVEAAAEAVSSRAGEADIERIARLAGLTRLLAVDVLVEAAEGGPAVRGREAVAGLASQLSAAAGPQALTLSDIEIAFNDVKTAATVTAVARLTSSSPGAAQTYDGQVIHLELTKNGQEWVISRARPELTLDR